MRKKLAAVAVLLGGAISLCAWMTYPWEYSYEETESGFRKIAWDGFDKETASRLIKQYELSDASLTKHFLAYGYLARLKNKAAFEVALDGKWGIIVKKIDDLGEASADDWFGQKESEELIAEKLNAP